MALSGEGTWCPALVSDKTKTSSPCGSRGQVVTDVREIIERIQARDYRGLHGVRPSVPEFFNWAADVFEPLHVTGRANGTALLFLDDAGQPSRFTFAELAARGNRLLNLLRERGLRRGDTVFVMLPVVPEVWFSYYAAIKGGLVLVPAATILTEKDIQYRFSQLQPAAVLADPASAEKIDAAERALGKSATVKIVVGGARPGWLSTEALSAYGEKAEAERTRSSDTLLIFFTSGTTGLPKMVVHTHASYPIGHLATAAWIGVRAGDLHYNISQPGWAKFAWSSFFAPLTVGATVFAYGYAGRFLAAKHLEAIQDHKVTTFCSAPTVWRMFVLEDLSKYRFSLREVVSAGEPLNPEVIVAWRLATGLTIRDGYGQTESTLMVGNLPDEDVKLGSMGRPSFLYDVFLADEHGQEVSPNEEGDIAVHLDPRPIGLFAKYVGPDADRYAQVFANNLYRTGDRAYRDAEGRLWFVGRSDDVIKASDYRIGPFEVESALLEHPAVAEAAVVGSPHAIRGNVVKAFVVLRPGRAPSKALADDLFQFTRANLTPYKAPKIIEFVSELPKTISGKIRRVELRSKEVEARSGPSRKPEEYFFEEVRKA